MAERKTIPRLKPPSFLTGQSLIPVAVKNGDAVRTERWPLGQVAEFINEPVAGLTSLQLDLNEAVIPVPTYLKPVEFIVPEQHTPNAGNGVVSADAAIQAVGDYGGLVRFTKGGVYKVSTALMLSPQRPLQWIFEAGATIDFSGLPDDALGLTVGADSRQSTTARSLTVDAEVGDASITLNNIAGLMQGAVLRLISNALYDPGRTNTNCGELIIVDAIEGSTVYLLTPLMDSYAVADAARCYVLDMQRNIVLDRPSLLGREGDVDDLALQSGLVVQYAEKPRIDGFEGRYFGQYALRLQDCLGGTINDPITEMRLPAGVQGYGISVMGVSQDILVRGHQSFGPRHAITTNSTNTGNRGGVVGLVTYENAGIYGTRKASLGSKVGGDAIDTHAAVRKIIIKEVDVYDSTLQGVNIEGTSAEIDGLRLYSTDSRGIRFANYTARDGSFSARRVRVESADGEALRVTQGPVVSGGGKASGRVPTVLVDGLDGRDYSGKLFYYQNLNGALGSVVEIKGLVGDAASSEDVNGQVYVQGAAHLIVSPIDLRNVPAGATGFRAADVPIISGSDLGRVAFAAGEATSGIGFRFSSTSPADVLGRVGGTIEATDVNTAEGFVLDAHIAGLFVESVRGNAATSGKSPPDETASYEAATIASDAITLSLKLPVSMVQLATEGGAGTDYLKSITPAAGTERGKILIVKSSSNAFAITVQHVPTGGNIELAGGRDRLLSKSRAALILIWDGASRWYEAYSNLEPLPVLAVSTSLTLAAQVAPRTSVEATGGVSGIATTLPPTALAGDEITVTKVDAGAGAVSVLNGVSEIASLAAQWDTVVARRSGAEWIPIVKSLA